MTRRMVVPPFTPGLKGSFPNKRAAKDFRGTGRRGWGGRRVVEPKAGPIPLLRRLPCPWFFSTLAVHMGDALHRTSWKQGGCEWHSA